MLLASDVIYQAHLEYTNKEIPALYEDLTSCVVDEGSYHTTRVIDTSRMPNYSDQ